MIKIPLTFTLKIIRYIFLTLITIKYCDKKNKRWPRKGTEINDKNIIINERGHRIVNLLLIILYAIKTINN